MGCSGSPGQCEGVGCVGNAGNGGLCDSKVVVMSFKNYTISFQFTTLFPYNIDGRTLN